ncbi:MAG: hypothetical protein ACNY01_02055 [Desulfobacteria bacterium]
MAKTLEKLLKRSDNIANQQVLLQASDIMDELQNNKNCLIIMDNGAYKINVLTNLLREYISDSKSIWLATSPITFSPFKLFWIRAGLGSELLSVRCHFEYVETNAPATLWSVDLLRDNIDALCSHDIKNLPDILVLENMDMLGDEYIGPCLEQVLLALPLHISIIAFISPVVNHREILDWLIKIRDGSWGELGTVSDSRQVLAYLTPEYDLIPLLQKKTIASKVKRSLKENKPVKSLASKLFIQPLVNKLKQENLTPTLIVMPSQGICNQAVQNCPKTRDDATEILSNPQITALFDRYPVLKDRKKVAALLYRQVGAFHLGNHPAWSEMIEILLSLNLIEAVFSTMYDAQALSARVKSVVLTTSQIVAPGEIQARSVSNIEFRRICQLTESMNNTDMRGCVVLAHGKHIDMVRLKNMQVISSLNAVNSKFKCNTQAILGLAGSTTRGVQNSVMMSFWAEQNELKETAPLVEKQTQLEELIPEARCGAPRTALTLIKTTQQFKFELDQWNMKIDTVKNPNTLSAIKKHIATLQLTISNFPCNGCVHQAECQDLRYKKIRNIFNQYSEILYQMKQSASILEVDLADKTEFLMNMGFLDFELKLTSKGKIALQSGCSNPFYITELIWHKKDFPWVAELTIPILAGFIELGLGATPLLVDNFVDEPLQRAYQWIEECIDPVRKQLYSNGVAVPEPSFAQSALVQALENGIGFEGAAEHTGISIGTITRLVQKTKYLGFRFGFLTRANGIETVRRVSSN